MARGERKGGMMREILFKAKRKENGEWVEGYYLNVAKINHFICTGKIKLNGAVNGILAPEMYAIDPDTLCQFTGFTDKNGKKIWENDVVIYDKFVGYVVFKKCQYIIKWINNENLRDDLYFWATNRKSLIWRVCDVFGIPELLEVE